MLSNPAGKSNRGNGVSRDFVPENRVGEKYSRFPRGVEATRATHYDPTCRCS